MKKTWKWLTAVMAAAMVLVLLCSCGGGSSLAGTWYCADDVDGETPLTLTSDGKFNLEDYGGEYSFENDQVVLVSAWESAVLNAEKIGGKTCLVDEDGGIWFNGRKAAQDYYEQETAKKFSEVESLCYGTFSFDDENEYLESNQLQLVLNKDHTYKYIYKGEFDDRAMILYIGSSDEVYTVLVLHGFDATQSGTWSLGYKGTLIDGDVCIVFSPKESSGYDDNTTTDWISENKPAPFTNIEVDKNGLDG